MTRTTVDEVRMEIEADGYPIEAITGTQLRTVGITPANLIVSEDLADAELSDKRLALIERYIAGHLILSSGVEELRQVDDESQTDGSSQTYAGDRDYADYRSTSLGQKAVNLDSSGTLENANKPPASLSVPSVR